MRGNFKKASLVASTSIVNNLLSTVFALIYNKLIIVHYGSSTTGLISTLGQFVSMFTIIEGGFSFAVVVASYKPIIDNDFETLNNILFTAKKYFNKISIIFIGIVMATGVVYIAYLDSPVAFFESLILLILTTSTTALSIGGLTKYTVVLSGHNKQYITIIISTICRMVTWSIAILFILCRLNIILVYSANVLNIFLNILILKYYEKKMYPSINYKGIYNLNNIKGVKDMMFQKIASTIFTSTDLVLVSLGLSLSKASVYYIYNQIFQGVYQYLSSLTSAPTDSFGHLMENGEYESAQEIFSIYKRTINILSTVFFAVTAVMIIPFIKIYTKNITDENYVMPSLAFVFFSYYYIKLNNMPYGMIINVTGNFSKQNKQTGIAAIANIVCSILLMRIIGLNGIVLGSIIGTMIIISANVVRAREVLAFDVKKDIILLILNYIISTIILYISQNKYFDCPLNYYIWMLISLIVLCFILFIVIVINYVLDGETLSRCFSYYYKKLNKKS